MPQIKISQFPGSLSVVKPRKEPWMKNCGTSILQVVPVRRINYGFNSLEFLAQSSSRAWNKNCKSNTSPKWLSSLQVNKICWNYTQGYVNHKEFVLIRKDLIEKDNLKKIGMHNNRKLQLSLHIFLLIYFYWNKHTEKVHCRFVFILSCKRVL